MWAGSLALNGLLSAGKEGDFATHKIEHAVSAVYDLAHGIGLAILFPHWMKYVMNENTDKFVEYAVNVWDAADTGDKAETAKSGIQKTREFFSSLGMPETFSEVNINEEKYEEMAEKAVYFGDIGNFKKLKKEDVIKILKLSS